MMRRLVLAIGIALMPLVAVAAPSPGPSAPVAGARDGGEIAGVIDSVDYQRNAVGVRTHKGVLDVNVMPSTSIQASDSAYHSITDLKPGLRVSIMSSVSNGKYVAQIIRIR
jgi:hypothetical protein